MNEQIGTLKIVNYDHKNIEHIRSKRELENDQSMKDYFGEFFIRNIESIFENADESTLEIKKGYFVQDEDHIIGFIRVFSKHLCGRLELQYGVLPQFRKQGYGTKILKEMKEYIYNHYDDVSYIDLDIDKQNIGSQKCAEEAGFNKENNKYRNRR